MLKNILNIKGIESIKKEDQKNISGGIGLCLDQQCPEEGGSCCGGPYWGPPCLAGPVNLVCVNNVWVAC